MFKWFKKKPKDHDIRIMKVGDKYAPQMFIYGVWYNLHDEGKLSVDVSDYNLYDSIGEALQGFKHIGDYAISRAVHVEGAAWSD